MSNNAERLLEEINGLVRNVSQAISRLAGDTTPPAAPAAPVNPGQAVNISLRVRGNLPRGGAGYQISGAVERALSDLGAQHGVTVVPGSVSVS